MTASVDKALVKDTVHGRPACGECQRRKQRCDREWPCGHCQKRKVGDKCNFNVDAEPNSAWTASDDVKRKRDSGHDADESDDEDTAADLEAMGYTASHLLANLEISSPAPPREQDQYRINIADCEELQRALDVLPPRGTIDALVRNFLENVNFYYYIVYPANFVREYAVWWKEREGDQPMGLPWTCLLIMICACSVQHTDAAMAAQLEAELGAPVKQLTERYHKAARQLQSTIPPSHSHVYTVQYFLHSCYWFKAEARFVECWQILGATVREAQTLGLHLEPEGNISDFKREMRSRLWCIVDSWDWLVSSLLARPMLIDRTDSTIGLPKLALEKFPVNPLLHLKLQSQLVGIIFKRFGPPRILTEPADIREYQEILERFMGTFPPAYAFENPDTVPEQTYPWIALHRHYMHTCTLSITLGAFRPYMAKNMTSDSSETEREFRSNGISYALRLLKAVQRFFEYVWSRDSTFHFVPFCIFDTAALLCSALLHDKDESIPEREEIAAAIHVALVTLKKLRSATETAKAPYDVLRRLVKKVWGPVSTTPDNNQHKRQRGHNPSPTPPPIAPKPVSHQPAPILAADPRTFVNPVLPPSLAAQCEQVAILPSPPNSVYRTQRPSIASVSSSGEQFVLNSSGPYEVQPTWAQGYHEQPPASIPIATHSPMNPTNGVAHWHEEELRKMLGNIQPIPLGPQNIPQTVSHVVPQAIPQTMPPEVPQDMFSNAQIGDLAQMWNWQSLDLGYTQNPIMFHQ